MRKRKTRKCKICGADMGAYRLRICESCQAAGMGREIRTSINTEELMNVANTRAASGTHILDEMTLDEIAALARLWRAPFCTYGRFRGYVDETGKLPPEEYLK